ncbi:MAG TPA: hypothetical protein V6D12_14310 [Candidatus Obscuribacterales bacterium]
MIVATNNRINLQPIDVSRSNEALKETETMLSDARLVVIKNQEQYNAAVETLKIIKAKAKDLEIERKRITTPLDAAKSAIMDLFRKPTEYLAEAEKIVKTACVAYTTEQERIRLEQERKLQEEARKAEEKRKRELEEQAKKWEAKGNAEKAEEKRQMAEEVYVPTPVVPVQVEKAANESYREIWKFRIVDESLIPREYLVVDEKLLGQTARNGKGKIKVPGVEFFSERTLAI